MIVLCGRNQRNRLDDYGDTAPKSLYMYRCLETDTDRIYTVQGMQTAMQGQGHALRHLLSTSQLNVHKLVDHKCKKASICLRQEGATPYGNVHMGISIRAIPYGNVHMGISIRAIPNGNVHIGISIWPIPNGNFHMGNSILVIPNGNVRMGNSIMTQMTIFLYNFNA